MKIIVQIALTDEINIRKQYDALTGCESMLIVTRWLMRGFAIRAMIIQACPNHTESAKFLTAYTAASAIIEDDQYQSSLNAIDSALERLGFAYPEDSIFITALVTALSFSRQQIGDV